MSLITKAVHMIFNKGIGSIDKIRFTHSVSLYEDRDVQARCTSY